MTFTFKRLLPVLASLSLCMALPANEPSPPRILGIVSVHILVTDIGASKAFYSKLLPEDHPCVWCGQGKRTTYSVNEYQFVELSQIMNPFTTTSPEGNLIDEIVFATDDLAALRSYLTAHSVQLSSPPPPDMEPSTPATKNNKKATLTKTKEPPLETFMTTLDPEGHRIGFIQLPVEAFRGQFDPRGKRLIHAGFVVRDAVAEDRFYKDVLGFHVYWHGGMKDGEDDWVDMQVPDGTDWIEYMLGVSPNATHETLGVMNHFAIGVSDIEAAAYGAKKSGISATEDPEIGRDGKWQLNLYDPDETRVEMMEFKPTKEPCCSPYTGPHPHPRVERNPRAHVAQVRILSLSIFGGTKTYAPAGDHDSGSEKPQA